jgi:hypothetical protein
VVHVDLDEIDPDRQDTSSCGGTDDSIGEVCCYKFVYYVTKKKIIIIIIK